MAGYRRLARMISIVATTKGLVMLSLLAFGILPAVGCGGHTVPPAQTSGLFIFVQPSNITVPLGATGQFFVTAKGATNVQYQWSKNGNPITGANGATYTTEAVTAADTKSTYTVLVSDGTTSIESKAASLTVGARSPRTGDLRFQSVGAPATSGNLGSPAGLFLLYPIWMSYPNVLGSPLRLGVGQCVDGVKQDCAWLYRTQSLSGTVSQKILYIPDLVEKLDSHIQSLTSSSVITSLDIESGEDIFALSAVQGGSGAFDSRHESASVGGLQSGVEADGIKGRVVTAVSFNDASGAVDFLSYGWDADTETVFDTVVMTSGYDDIGQAAKAIAAGGFIITAFGGNGPDGYILIGTKVHGDSIPRDVLVSPDASTSTAGYALVGWAVGDSPSPPVWIYER